MNINSTLNKYCQVPSFEEAMALLVKRNRCELCGQESDDLKVVDYEGSVGVESMLLCPKCRRKGGEKHG